MQLLARAPLQNGFVGTSSQSKKLRLYLPMCRLKSCLRDAWTVKIAVDKQGDACMDTVQIITQWLVGLGILNVWLLRSGKATSFRGGDAKNMKEEFAVYGLPPWFMYLIGACKITLALMLLAGTWIPALAGPAALGMAVLMAGAVTMHIKVKDSVTKTAPSLTVLALCILIALSAA
jgi:uncharacterized membrane protein YphA (DoxX/SURF4 family)